MPVALILVIALLASCDASPSEGDSSETETVGETSSRVPVEDAAPPDTDVELSPEDPAEIAFGTSAPSANESSIPTPSQPKRSRTTSEPREQNRVNDPWYSGGSLHGAKMRAWSRASYANRLATSADFATKMMQMDGLSISAVDQVKPIADELERCISETNAGGDADNQDAATVAATCWVIVKQQ